MLEDFCYYGKILNEYTGQGTLTLNLNKKINCEFEIAQYENGRIILICKECVPQFEPFIWGNDEFSSFEGVTEDGLGVTCNKGYIGPFDCSLNITVFISEFIVKKTNSECVSIEFGITNFIFYGEKIIENNTQIEKLSLNLGGFSEISIINLFPNANVDAIKEKGCELTSLLRVVPTKGREIKQVVLEVDNICDIISIMRGTKITWLYYTWFNETGEIIGKCHANRITKTFSPLYLISPRDGRDETKYFIESVYPNFVERKNNFHFDTPLLNVYLEAKEETTYISTRASCLVITLEMIMRVIYFSLPERKYKEKILEKNDFSKLKRCLKKAIHDNLDGDDKKETRSLLYHNLECVNRTSFSDLIEDFNSLFSCNFGKDEITAVINSRNALIHTGNFYCLLIEDENKTKDRSKLGEEYFFLTHFLDKIILKIIGYSGPYWSWEHGPSPTRLELK